MNKKWKFECNRWLDKEEDDGRIELELIPQVSDLYDINRTEYEINVFTGDLKKSGTDSEVYIAMIGEKGETIENHLSESSTHMNKFERNQVANSIPY